MSLNLEEIIEKCFRALPAAFETGKVTPEADQAVYAYVRYWVDLGSPRDRVMLRCERLLHSMHERAAIPPEREPDVPRIARTLSDLCSHHFAGLSALRATRSKRL